MEKYCLYLVLSTFLTNFNASRNLCNMIFVLEVFNQYTLLEIIYFKTRATEYTKWQQA